MSSLLSDPCGLFGTALLPESLALRMLDLSEIPASIDEVRAACRAGGEGASGLGQRARARGHL